ncbi:molecular chaperone [Salmonella enterica]|nr:molecular chaperone [Salmonella enterica]EGM2645622.1 molecular chaperone [Salmonella enterica]EGM2983561.1 molecular chaperone [Salmonella enterica]EJU6033233.1 molecular chaperone [Salmonella enterica]
MMKSQWRCITIFVMLMAAGISSVLAIPSNTDISLVGIGTDRTRYIYPEGTRQIGLTLRNDTHTNYLIQAWVRGIDPKTGDVRNEQAPFFLKQPLLKATPGGSYGFQLIQTKPVVLLDRESVWLLSFRIIPSENRTEPGNVGTGQIGVVMTYNVKLFYRPAGLKEAKVATAAKTLSFRHSGDVLKIKNTSPLWITFYSLTVNGKPLAEESLRQMVPPLGEANYPLPGSESFGRVVWRVIDEKGGVTKEMTTMM